MQLSQGTVQLFWKPGADIIIIYTVLYTDSPFIHLLPTFKMSSASDCEVGKKSI